MHACIQTLIAKPETAGKGVLLSFDQEAAQTKVIKPNGLNSKISTITSLITNSYFSASI